MMHNISHVLGHRLASVMRVVNLVIDVVILLRILLPYLAAAHDHSVVFLRWNKLDLVETARVIKLPVEVDAAGAGCMFCDDTLGSQLYPPVLLPRRVGDAGLRVRFLHSRILQ